MSNKITNEKLKEVSIRLGDDLGGSACKSCTKSFCCEYQHQIGISAGEFDKIVDLITPEQIQRAKEQLTNTFTLPDGHSTYRCPFLSEAGKCEIYEERFAICAVYSVVGSNVQCSLDNIKGKVNIVSPVGVFQQAMNLHPDVNTRIRAIAEGTPSDVLEEFKLRFPLGEE